MGGFAHVAIDGPAGSGKTTVARALGRRLGIRYLDTGIMYRALAWLALRSGVDPGDKPALLSFAEHSPVLVVPSADPEAGCRVTVGERDPGDGLYASDVSRAVSVLAAYPEIRRAMVGGQRAAAARGPLVMVGRDIGTVVLPEAPYKVFLTASLDERIARRAAELERAGTAVDLAQLRRDIEQRDRRDTDRAVAPLRAAAGALEIDSTGTSVAAVVARIAAFVGAP